YASRTILRVAHSAAVLLLSLAILAGCSNVKVGHTLDEHGAASQISQNLATTTGLPAPKVHCPAGVHVVTKGTFDCTTILDGQPLTVHVTLTDEHGHFTVSPGAAIMVLADVEQRIKAPVDQQTASISTVNCGPHRVLVEKPGGAF